MLATLSERTIFQNVQTFAKDTTKSSRFTKAQNRLCSRPTKKRRYLGPRGLRVIAQVQGLSAGRNTCMERGTDDKSVVFVNMMAVSDSWPNVYILGLKATKCDIFT